LVAEVQLAKKCFSCNGGVFSLDLGLLMGATFVESPAEKTKGRYKAVQRIEEMDQDVAEVARAFDLLDRGFKTNIPFSVYNQGRPLY